LPLNTEISSDPTRHVVAAKRCSSPIRCDQRADAGKTERMSLRSGGGDGYARSFQQKLGLTRQRAAPGVWSSGVSVADDCVPVPGMANFPSRVLGTMSVSPGKKPIEHQVNALAGRDHRRRLRIVEPANDVAEWARRVHNHSRGQA
jgi:hypothetical protein